MSWCATEKEAYAILKSMQCFNYYLQGMKCTLYCNHKPLEPFLTRGMKIAKLDRWAMLLQEYDITFVHIKLKDNILADARHVQKGNRDSALTCSKDSHHTTR